MSRSALVMALILLWPTASLAQSKPTLTLDEAIAIAVQRNRAFDNARVAQEQAAQDIAQARSRRLPSLTAEGQISRLLRPVEVTFPAGAFGTLDSIGAVPSVDTTITTPLQTNLVLNASVSQPITGLLKATIVVRQSEAAHAIAIEHVRAARLGIVNHVRRTYYAILQSLSALQAADTNGRLLAEVARVVQTRVAQKVALRTDSLEMETRVAQNELTRGTLRDALASSKEQLNQLLGRDLTTDFEVVQVEMAAVLDNPAATAIEHDAVPHRAAGRSRGTAAGAARGSRRSQRSSRQAPRCEPDGPKHLPRQHRRRARQHLVGRHSGQVGAVRLGTSVTDGRLEAPGGAPSRQCAARRARRRAARDQPAATDGRAGARRRPRRRALAERRSRAHAHSNRAVPGAGGTLLGRAPSRGIARGCHQSVSTGAAVTPDGACGSGSCPWRGRRSVTTIQLAALALSAAACLSGCATPEASEVAVARAVRVVDARAPEPPRGLRYAVTIQPSEHLALAVKAGGYVAAIREVGTRGRPSPRAAARRCRAGWYGAPPTSRRRIPRTPPPGGRRSSRSRGWPREGALGSRSVPDAVRGGEPHQARPRRRTGRLRVPPTREPRRPARKWKVRRWRSPTARSPVQSTASFSSVASRWACSRPPEPWPSCSAASPKSRPFWACRMASCRASRSASR